MPILLVNDWDEAEGVVRHLLSFIRYQKTEAQNQDDINIFGDLSVIENSLEGAERLLHNIVEFGYEVYE